MKWSLKVFDWVSKSWKFLSFGFRFSFSNLIYDIGLVIFLASVADNYSSPIKYKISSIHSSLLFTLSLLINDILYFYNISLPFMMISPPWIISFIFKGNNQQQITGTRCPWNNSHTIFHAQEDNNCFSAYIFNSVMFLLNAIVRKNKSDFLEAYNSLCPYYSRI